MRVAVRGGSLGRPAVRTGAALVAVAATASPAYADNCSGLADCSFVVQIGLVVLAIVLAVVLWELFAAAAARAALVAALRAAGTSFTEAAIVGIVRTAAGRVVWLETGTAAAGLAHILQRHGSQFATWGLRTGSQISQFILRTLQTGTPIAVHAGGAVDYAVRIGGVDRIVRIVIGSNGFIVTAHPL